MIAKTFTGTRAAVAAALLAGLLTHGAAAHADTTSPAYGGDLCRPAAVNDATYATIDTANHTIANKAAAPQSISVICPVTKTTSGPTIQANDQIYGTSVSQYSPSAGGVACILRIYSSYYDPSAGYNVIMESPSQSTASGTTTFTMGGLSAQAWWNRDYWYYANVVCTLQPGAKINSYTVSERGTPQANHRIFSTASCAPDAGSTSVYVLGDSLLGGYLEGLSGGSFALGCPVPATAQRGIQLSAGPSIGGLSTFECSYDNAHWITVPANPGNTDFPTRLVQLAFAPGNQNLRCRRTGADSGDPKLFTYRSYPLTKMSHSGWAATANPAADAGKAIDDANTTDRWTTGTGQNNNPAENQWFQLNLGSAKTFHQIVLDSTASANDFPRGYKVYASNSTSSWGTPIAQGAGTGDVVTIPVPPTTKQYIKITQTSTTPARWWSITKLDVYTSTAPGP